MKSTAAKLSALIAVTDWGYGAGSARAWPYRYGTYGVWSGAWSKNVSGLTHLISASPDASFGSLGSVLQSILFIVPSYSDSGYIIICCSTGWMACRSSGVSSMKMRGATKPVLVEARKI